MPLPPRPARSLLSLVFAVLLFAAGVVAPLRAQRQMEALGRGVVAMRTSSTQVYIGWRLLGGDPSDLGFNLYRSIGGGAAARLNGSTPITASTNYLDTPGSTALASALSYYVVPVRNGVEQTASAAYTLPAGATSGQQYIRLPLSTAYPNSASTAPYDVKFCWVGDFDGDGEYDFLVDRVSTSTTAEKQFLEAYKRDGTFLWRMDMGVNSVNQYAYEPGASAISVGDTDNVTVYDLDGDGKAEVAVRTANGVTVTNAAGAVVATIGAADNTTQFVSIINGLTGAELARTTLPNPWAQYGTLTNKCAIGYFDGQRPSVLFYGYNRNGSAEFYRVFTAFDYRNGQLTQRWTWAQNTLTTPGSEGHQIRIADVDNDGKDEVCDIGHVIDDNGTQLFVIPEISHGDRFHIADINPDRPGLENYVIQQNNPSFLATAYYDAGTGQVLKKWYATDVVDVGRGIALDINSTHKGYEMYSTQPGIYNARAQQIYSNNVWAPEGLWWDADLLREFIDGAGNGALNPVINKFNQTTGVSDRVFVPSTTTINLYNDGGAYSIHQAYGGRPAFWGDILGDWREELVFVTSDYTALRIYTTTNVATNRLYTLMHNPAYRCQATTKGYVQSSNVDYYLGVGMTTPPPPPMVPATLAWTGGAGASTWDAGATSAWKNTASSASSVFATGNSVRFDIAGANAAPVALSGVLQPGEVTVYSPTDYTFDGSAGSLSGAMKLVKAGKGSLRITGSHDFTGATTVWDGALRVDGTLSASPVTVWGGVWGGALAKGLTGGRLAGSGTVAQPVSLQYRGAITPGAGMNAAGTLSLGAGLGATDGSALAFDLSTDPAGLTLANDRLAITGNLALSGTVALVINPLAGQLSPGTYTLLTYTGALTGSAANLSIVIPEGTPYTVALGSGALTLTIPVTRSAGTVTWTGSVSGAWDLANTANWRLSGASEVFVSGDGVTFDDTGAARPAVTLNVPAPVSSLTFSGSASYTISGNGAIGGTGGLLKSGSGTVTLSTTNTFTGPVSVTGGVLAVDNLADGGEPSSIGASSAAASNFILNGGTLRIAGSQTNTNRALTLGSAGGVIDTPVTFQISGGITGSGALTKTGSGTLILASANTHSGGTILQAGTLVLASDTANTSGLGSGGLTLQGGTLRMYDNINSYNTSAWPITVPAGASARFEADGRSTLAGALSGSGTLEFYTTYIRTEITGNWSAFSGTFNLTADSDGGDLRLSNSNGMAGALFNAGANTSTYSIVNASTTFALGALSGSGTLSGNDNAGRTTTWQIGARNLDTTFAGPIVNGKGPAALTKVGAGALTLTGASTYTGATTVSAGKLVLAGGSLSGTAVTVQSGGAFGGRGSVTGNVTFNAGSILLANPSGGPLAITGNLVFGGSVTVSPAPGATLAAGTYPLYTYTGSLTGTPSFAWSGAGFSATFDTSVSGQVSITLQNASQPPTGLAAVAGDGQASLTWNASATATSYSVLRSTVSGGPYTAVASGLTATAYVNTGLTNGITYYYVVAAIDSGGGSASSAQASVSVGGSAPYACWRLDETSGATAADSSGNGRPGTLINAPAWTTGRLDNGLALTAASSQHLTLPAGIVSPLNDFTLSLWVKMTSVSNWARLVDFGTGTTNYLFITPKASTTGFMRFAIRTAAVAEQVIDSSVVPATGSWAHVAVTLSGSTGTLYLNGVAVGTNPAMTLTPASLGSTTQNYFGRSQFAADPYLNGTLDEIRIHARALTAAEIALLAAPPAAPASPAAFAGNGRVALNWSAVPGAAGYAVKRSTTSGGPYVTIASGLTGASYTDSGLPNGVTYYYVFTALKTPAESANSAEVSATPMPPVPPAPGGLFATAGDAQVTLSWTASFNATSYSVLRSTTSGSGYGTVAGGLSSPAFTDTGLANGTAYYYVVTASNMSGTSSASSEVSATPVAPLTPRENWRVTHFGGAAATGDAADTADPDADGLANLLEYALGGDPLQPDGGLLPSLALSADHLALSFTRIADPALVYTVQAAADPASTWSEVWSSTAADNTAGPVTVVDPAAFSGNPRRFLRLRVTAP